MTRAPIAPTPRPVHRSPHPVVGLLTLLASVAGGCGLVLDDPLPFQPQGGADARVVDAAPVAPDQMIIDQFIPPPPDMALRFDVGPVVDARLQPDEGVADAAPPDADPCGPEICNGQDDDCDGRTDEAVSDQCGACGVAGQVGACQVGVFYCIGGNLQCVPMPPVAAGIVACNLVDDDCDGVVDEAEEGEAARTALGASALIACGPPPAPAPPTYGACVDEAPGTVGCGAVHACRDAACLDACDADRAAAEGPCAAECPANLRVAERGRCLQRCQAEADADRRTCQTLCPAGVATRFSCAGGLGGADCLALDCPPGTVASERACVPGAPDAGADAAVAADLGPPADAEADAGP